MRITELRSSGSGTVVITTVYAVLTVSVSIINILILLFWTYSNGKFIFKKH